ncbi:phosphoglycolate phosphatase [Candidatus Tenderia electrophaga]|jgi:phosphoglycolate phosphatase|uniref:Phosphoglycolate phosphatase n=1 Tax=Candidatus Tenderia electrophaga TaxID=1748243 RepID=A0A0S2THH4_9GAMM|nr:phosphoglycolate phosphatase [Candidatus Tenderia electrophaga]
MRLRKPKLVLIDLDGTLVDSVPDLAYCVDEMMKALGRAPWGEETVRGWVGNGVDRLVMRALTNTLWDDPEDDEFEAAHPIFMKLYAENTSGRSCLYAGVVEGIDYLKGEGLKVGCVTNKAAAFTVPLLKAMGIYEKFDIVVSGDTTPKKKPDPMPLLHAANQLGVKAENCLMVGDSMHDVEAARNAGFQVVCVPYGYNHGVDIREAGPDAVIDSLAELKNLLK